MIETKMDPLAASFAAMEEPPHEEASPPKEDAQNPAEKVAEHIAAVKHWMDAHTVIAVRPALAGTKSMPHEQSDFTAHYLRRGLETGLESKSFDGTSGAAGGFAIPQEIDAVIDRTLNAISPIRAIANVVKVGSAGYRKLVTTGGTPSGWVAEDAARPETDTPDFAEIAPPMGELYANPAASQAMLDDAAFDVEAWLASEIAREFAQAEGAAFVSGSGVNRPMGFLSATITDEDDEVRAFGSLQYIATGNDGGFGAVEALSGNRFRLSRLLRGRRGSEWAMAIHGVGDRFVLLDAVALKALDAPVSTIGGSAELLATGLGDSESPVSVQMDIIGRSVRPPPPVHLNAHRKTDGAIRFTWIRRSRIGWAWTSGSDAPLGEEVERWRITIEPALGQSRTIETDHSLYNYSVADQLVDGSETTDSFSLSIVQLGVFAKSDPPARVTIIL